MFHKLNEKEDYKDLRDMVQQIGVNSGHYNENKNPFDVIDKAYEKKGFEKFDVDKYFDKNKNTPAWFNDIMNEYILLDMHGFKADKVKVTEKEKNTFKNTTEDASHAAFASKCEFYITNDDKNYHKTKAVYQKLNIYTNVLKPNEFIDYYNTFLNIHSFDEHFKLIIELIKSGENFQDKFYNNNEQFGWVSYTPQHFFNFFNRIMVPKPSEDNALFILGKDNPSNNYMIAQEEIEATVKMFSDKLGLDKNGKSYYEASEINKNQDWIGRSWETNIGLIEIKRLNGWFQMYFYPIQDNQI
jgi:hypothetical protein